MVSLKTSVAGIEFPNPVIAGSSGLTGNIQSIQQLLKQGVGGIILKSLFEEQIMMESRMEADKGGVIYGQSDIDSFIRFYQRKHSLAEYLKLIHQTREESKVPVIASINCISLGEWIDFAEEIQTAGAEALQLNIFNLSNSNPAGIIRAIKLKIQIPLIIKLGFYSTDLGALASDTIQAGADALVFFNRPYSFDFDIEKISLKLGAFFSSHEEMALPLRWISLLSGRIGAPLFASTGIQTGDDVVKMLLAGAAGVEVVSSLYKNKPQIIGQMLTRLEAWMEAHGFDSIDSFKGRLCQAESKMPESYERVQFMKYFGDLQDMDHESV